MKAIRLIEHGHPLVEQDLPDPSPRDGEIVVDVVCAGICHSDAHYRAEPGRANPPITLGHEVAGVVSGTGQRVALHYLLPNGDMLGKEVNGGYAQKIVVPAENAIPIPDNVPFDAAAIMMCSTATAYHALRLSNIQPGESLAILGFGGLGVSAAQLAPAFGVKDVIAVDVVPEKLALAKQFGARTGDLNGVDVALEFTGNAAVAQKALRALAPGGRLMIVAINLRSMTFDPFDDLLRREHRIIGCADHTREELVELMELARRGEIDLTRAITRTVPLEADAINAALDDLERQTSHLRTVIAVR
ncbi:MAG TPA: zinc-binding dehydrogenase [Thermoanaerobaculia bacterium]|jgi:propanol-preferring alcohol dehydrogenase|nr:zinc-binding dehydrogenase [Thermoanaerobaculia bacterium]